MSTPVASVGGTATVASNFLTLLLEGRPQAPERAPDWFTRLRSASLDRVGVLTVPTTRDEEWRFTDIAPLAGRAFEPVQTAPTLLLADIARFNIEEAAQRLVFVDGVFAPALSTGVDGPGVQVTTLARALAARTPGIEAHLGIHAGYQDQLFSALNTAFLRDGALIMVPPETAVADPVHLLFIATRKDGASHPRCLVSAGPGSAVTVVEDYVALTDEAYFTNAVTEIALADNARVAHVRVQRESGAAFHIGRCAVSLGRAAAYRSVGVALGARISRLDHCVTQAGIGSECTLDALALIGGSQIADTHSVIDHGQAHGTSRQLHKCIVGAAAQAVFNGKVLVRQGAQKTDSAQSSRNLLLSPKARVDTKPQLEIFADDVKCAHGATVGQLDTDEVFYLQSRGLSEPAAKSLLTYAFGAEIIDRIPIRTLKTRLGEAVLANTAGTP